MDRSLDEIIAERPQKQSRGRRSQGRRRDGVKKPYRDERLDMDFDWVHDKFEDDRDSRASRPQRRPRGDRYSPSPNRAPTGARVRVENLHYDITEGDLEGLFSRIGPVSDLSLRYDRAGRSEGTAFVTYRNLSDARLAIREFDGANAKGQPIHLTMTAVGNGRRERNPFDNVENPRSLFDRIEQPHGRDSRSLSPGSDSINGDGGRRRRSGRRSGRRNARPRPSTDRYVPRRRSPRRGAGGGRRREPRPRTDEAGHSLINGRPRKTQEELDQEMDDYWGTANPTTDDTPAAQEANADEAPQVAPPTAAAAGDDDVDMIE